MRRSLRLSLLGLIGLALFAVVSCSKETTKNDKAKSDKAPENTTEAPAEEPTAEAPAAEEPAAETPAEEPTAEAPAAEEPAAEAPAAEVKLQDLGIDGLDLAEVGVWEAEVPDAAVIQKVLAALVYTEQAPSAGKRRWTLTCKSKGETVAEVFVYPDGEWGYGSQTRGLSVDLVTLLESLPGELGIELGEGD